MDSPTNTPRGADMAQVIKHKKLTIKSGTVMARMYKLKGKLRTFFDKQSAKIKIKVAVITMALTIAKARN
jgi:hypothetical protein